MNDVQFEFIFRKPAFLATCMYGTVFVLLGNLSGNAIAFGQYVYEASGFEPSPDQPNAPRGPVIAVAIALLTGCILIHFFSRRGGIMINNLFAIFKIALLLAIAVLGFIKAGGSRLGMVPCHEIAIRRLTPRRRRTLSDRKF